MRKLADALEVPLDLMMLLSIESGDQSKVAGDALSHVAQSLLAMLTNPEAEEHAV